MKNKEIENLYEHYLNLTGKTQAAATLVTAEQVRRLTKLLAKELPQIAEQLAGAFGPDEGDVEDDDDE